jgi:hypothetical protein
MGWSHEENESEVVTHSEYVLVGSYLKSSSSKHNTLSCSILLLINYYYYIYTHYLDGLISPSSEPFRSSHARPPYRGRRVPTWDGAHVRQHPPDRAAPPSS